MSHAAAVETDDLVKEYASVRALDGVSVRVDPGETFGLLGPNGAGKTTFIELLVGLADPTGGEARVFGHDVVDAVLSSPMSHAEQTVAWVLASAARGALVGLGILLLGRLFTPVPLSRPVTLAAFLVVVSLLFGGVGVLIGLWADDFDQLNLFNQFLLRPLVFIGGVFYPITDLPPLLRTATLFNPFFYMVNGFRAGLIGYAEATTRLSFAVLVATTAAVLLLAVGLVGRGYGLRS